MRLYRHAAYGVGFAFISYVIIFCIKGTYFVLNNYI